MNQQVQPSPDREDGTYFTDIWPAFYTPRTPKLCGAEGTRNRVCAADKDHTGNHNWVPRTVRED